MPELPEVETVVRALRPLLVGRTIKSFSTDWEKQIKTHSLEDFQRAIKNQTIKEVARRAKWIVIGLTSLKLVVHLRMSGHLFVAKKKTDELEKYVHGRFELDKGELRFRDTRKFGTMHLVQSTEEMFAKLGPEPLAREFTKKVLKERLVGRKTMLKPLLLDQGFVAGIGNIYADEALFEAKLHPRRRADTLKSAEVGALHKAIRKVLQLGIDREGASISTYVLPSGEKGSMQEAVNVFRRTAAPCFTCTRPIKRIKLASRSTHYCGSCQAGDDSDDASGSAAASAGAGKGEDDEEEYVA